MAAMIATERCLRMRMPGRELVVQNVVNWRPIRGYGRQWRGRTEWIGRPGRGPRKGTYGSSSLYAGDQHRRLFLRSAKPVAARVEREHQRPAETVLSEGHRLIGALASLSEQSGSSAKRTTH